MKHLNLKNTVAKGFSLVEMLVVIAVIGVIAAIAIPSIGSINKSAKDATAQRNAQNIVSMFQAGEAAGVVWGASSASDAVDKVVTGGQPADGAFAGKSFSVPHLDPLAKTDALVYLDFTGGELSYNKAGTAPTGP